MQNSLFRLEKQKNSHPFINFFRLKLGKGFVASYYALFDDPNQRNSLVNMYNVSWKSCEFTERSSPRKFQPLINLLISFQNELSFMTFEGQQIQGAPKILEKLQVKSPNALTLSLMTNVYALSESHVPKNQSRHHSHRFAANVWRWSSHQCVRATPGKKSEVQMSFKLNLFSFNCARPTVILLMRTHRLSF